MAFPIPPAFPTYPGDTPAAEASLPRPTLRQEAGFRLELVLPPFLDRKSVRCLPKPVALTNLEHEFKKWGRLPLYQDLKAALEALPPGVRRAPVSSLGEGRLCFPFEAGTAEVFFRIPRWDASTVCMGIKITSGDAVPQVYGDTASDQHTPLGVVVAEEVPAPALSPAGVLTGQTLQHTLVTQLAMQQNALAPIAKRPYDDEGGGREAPGTGNGPGPSKRPTLDPLPAAASVPAPLPFTLKKGIVALCIQHPSAAALGRHLFPEKKRTFFFLLEKFDTARSQTPLAEALLDMPKLRTAAIGNSVPATGKNIKSAINALRDKCLVLEAAAYGAAQRIGRANLLGDFDEYLHRQGTSFTILQGRDHRQLLVRHARTFFRKSGMSSATAVVRALLNTFPDVSGHPLKTDFATWAHSDRLARAYAGSIEYFKQHLVPRIVEYLVDLGIAYEAYKQDPASYRTGIETDITHNENYLKLTLDIIESANPSPPPPVPRR